MRHIAASLIVVAAGPIATQAAESPRVERIVGICHLAENHVGSPPSAVNGITPALAASEYMRVFEHRKVDPSGAETFLRQPRHGKLIPVSEEKDLGYYYVSQDGFVGFDQVTVLVETSGLRIELRYFIHVMEEVPDESEGFHPYDMEEFCPQGKGKTWRITK